MKIITYLRPWIEEQFTDMVNYAYPSANVKYITDFVGSKGEELELSFNNLMSNTNKVSEIDIEGLSTEEINDIIARCRLLRSIDYEMALKLIYCMWNSISEIFDRFKPDFATGLIVDSYVIDLISRKCEKIGIPYYGIWVNFVKGYFRLTVKGEYKKLYSPREVDVENVWNGLIAKRERPYFIENTPVSPLGVALFELKNQLKKKFRYYYFKTKRMMGNDKYCYHYWTSELLSKTKITLNLNVISNDWKEKLESKKDLKVFLPLQGFPEATVDYWVPKVDYIDYYKVLFKILDNIQNIPNTLFFIKEHPELLGMLRPKHFYKNLLKYKNVVIVPANLNALDLIEATDSTLVWTGTAGIEAALRGKSVIHLGNPYYVKGKLFHYLESLDNLKEVLSNVASQIDYTINKEEQLELIKYLMEGMLPGQFKIPYRSKDKWIYDKNEIREVALSLRNYHEQNA